MRRKCKRLPGDESGAAIIEIVMIVPVVLILVAGLLDLSLLIRSELALNSAATAVVRLCMDSPESAENGQALKSYAEQVEPSVSNARISVAMGPESTESYTYHFYTRDSDSCITRENSLRSSIPITVEIALTREYFTPIGKGISFAAGGDGTLTIRASQSGLIDTTRGDKW